MIGREKRRLFNSLCVVNLKMDFAKISRFRASPNPEASADLQYQSSHRETSQASFSVLQFANTTIQITNRLDMADKNSLPPLASIPPANIRLSIAPEEWEACLDGWLTLTNLYLRLPQQRFKDIPGNPLAEFLASFYHEKADAESGDATLRSTTAQKLQRVCFRLVHRCMLERKPPEDLPEFDFLADFCRVHLKTPALSSLMSEIWRKHHEVLERPMLKKKNLMLSSLDLPSSDEMANDLRQLSDLMLASPDIATLFMTGTDFLDGLVAQYTKSTSSEQRKVVTASTYLGLLALVKTKPSNISMLSDHLYSLKAQADQDKNRPSLLAELVTNTSLISKLRLGISGPSADRMYKLLDTLETYRTPSIAQPKRHVHRKAGKGKARVVHNDGEMHMHRMSLVTQVQDLFPDLGSGFILKLFDEFGDDVEQVTAHLLDDSLPSHLQALDRTEGAPTFDTSQAAEIDHLVPRSTPPPPERFIPERRNVFDDDEFDRLEVDAERLHIGKKKDTPPNSNSNKAAILSALAAFDSDDDERDDTYDVEDVGGTVDTSHPDGEPGPAAKVTQEENDMALFTAYKTSPDLFGRTFDIRHGQARQALKAETSMTDEAIEGWAIMLQRDPKRLSKLEAKAAGSFDGKQTELARTSYRESETEDSEDAGRGGFRGGGGGRGRGRGRGGRGGNVAGPSSDPSTANAQRRKEASKGSRANHNRRDQRARKMGRGGFPG